MLRAVITDGNPRIRDKEWERQYYQKNKARFCESMRKYRLNHPAYTPRSYWRVKESLFHILGHICVECGEFDKRVLQFDHINSGGYQDRIKFNDTPRKQFKYYTQHPEEATEKLQILCANCNWRKRYEVDSER